MTDNDVGDAGVSDDGGPQVGGHRASSKPMQSDDFHRVEQELAKQLHHGKGSGSIQRLPSWQGSEDAMLLQSLGVYREMVVPLNLNCLLAHVRRCLHSMYCFYQSFA